jgi:hypothetical protein
MDQLGPKGSQKGSDAPRPADQTTRTVSVGRGAGNSADVRHRLGQALRQLGSPWQAGLGSRTLFLLSQSTEGLRAGSSSSPAGLAWQTLDGQAPVLAHQVLSRPPCYKSGTSEGEVTS